MLNLLSASILLASALGQHPASDIVQTKYGKVQGLSFATRSGFKADVFFGVPFAQPPVAKLRFEKPEPPLPWEGVRTTDRLQDACVGLGLFGPYNMSDDCLYLNIVAPQPQDTTKSYAVMVIIHGGGFLTGSAHMYRDYNDLAESYVSKGIVVVTIQYRLFVHGYASLGSDALRGNLGHWDQVAALKFVQSNIGAFGGDPKRITVYGYSAGSVSASSLSVSPHSRDLFAKTVEMSGSVLAEWAGSDFTLASSKQLLSQLECTYKTDDEAKRCLKAASNDDIAAAIQKMNSFPRRLNSGMFGPRIDGDFFPKPAAELVKEAPKKPTYAGMCEEESLLFTAIPMSGLFLPPEKQSSFNENDFLEFLDVVVDTEVFGARATEVRGKITEFYLSKEAPGIKDNTFFLRRYIQLCSDVQFNVPILREAVLKTELKWPVYLYMNHYFPKNKLVDLPFEAVTHSYDHQFVFRGDNQYYPMNYTEEDEEVSEFLVESVASFVKTGDTSTKTVAWPRTTRNHPLRHLRIGHRPEVRDLLFAERLHFWNSLADQFGYDIVQGLPAQLQKVKQEL